MDVFLADQPRQAVLLAAGMGSRLGGLTARRPKCLVPVRGKPMLQRAIERLVHVGVEQLILVTGYQAPAIEPFARSLAGGLDLRFIHNSDYAATNNIYSLWLARQIIQPPFLLVESDVIFNDRLAGTLTPPSAASLCRLGEGMDGTVVTLDRVGRIDRMYLKDDPRPTHRPLYKTVNLYSLDAAGWKAVRPRLEAFIDAGKTHCYYEAVFAQAIADGALTMRGAVVAAGDWHEIDTPADLARAEAALREPQP